jgi:hypothetical protein
MMSESKSYANGALVEHLIDGLPQPIIGTPAQQPAHPARHPSQARFKPKWPKWAKALKHLAQPEDKGIGDVVARMIGAGNSAAFKAWYKLTFGKDCGCTDRQADWNRKYPLGIGD